MFSKVLSRIPSIVKLFLAAISLALLIPYFGFFSDEVLPLPTNFEDTLERGDYED